MLLPPDPDSTLFPVDVVTAIVKDPQAAFVLLGFWNFAYEKVRLVEGIIVDEIAEVNVYELKNLDEIILITLYPE